MSSSKILIIISNALGDFINFLPFLKHINCNYPDFKTILMTKKYYFDIFEYSNSYKIDEFIDIDNFPLYKLFSKNFNSLKLKNFLKEYSMIISFTGTNNNIFKKNIKSLNKNSYFIFPINKDANIHEVEYILNSFNFSKRFYAKPELILPESRKEYIAIHPGSGDRKKNVSLNFLLKISKKFNVPVKFFGGENEIVLKEKIEIEICQSIKDAVNVLKKAIFYIGNDSGISHLASAFNIPTFTFFGPTSFRTWRPYGEKNIVFTKNLSCSPCDFKCSKNFECLKFDLDEILNLILNIYKNSFY